MVDPSDVRIIVPEPPTRNPQQIWWGLIGTLVGAFYAFATIPAVGHGWWEESRDEALRVIYMASAGAAMGFALEVARDQWDRRPSIRSFSLRSFLLFCYVAAVAIYIVSGLLTLHLMQ